MNSPDIFISYSTPDRSHALELVERLQERGISAWIDRNAIDGAAKWGKEIVEAINDCKVFVVLLSRASLDSHNVIKEISLASEKKKHILPLDLDQVTLTSDFEYPLAGIHRVEYKNFDAIERSLAKLGITTSSAPSTPHSQLSTKNSELRTVAVLPFDNISPEKDTDWFSDGLTEELIGTLSRLKDLRVPSRTSVMEYKRDKPNIKTIAEELGVRYIVEGSVRKHEKNLRISAQLIDAQDDKHIWSETFKGTMEDIFDIQESVALKIVEGVKIFLTPEEKKKVEKRYTENAEAYELYLQGDEYFLRTTKQDILYAIDMYREAIGLDPNFALAYSGMSNAYSNLYRLYDRTAELLIQADEAARKAVELDSTLPNAFSASAFVYHLRGDLPQAIIAAKKAIELNPQKAYSYYRLGFIYAESGQMREAAEENEKAIELDPNYLFSHYNLATQYYNLKDTENCNRVVERALPLFVRLVHKHPDDQTNRMRYSVLLGYVGRYEECEKELEKVLALPNIDSATLRDVAAVYNRLDKKDRSLELYEKAVMLNPNYLPGHYNLVSQYNQLNDKENCKRAAERALPLYKQHIHSHPDDQQGRQQYSYLFACAARYEEGEKEIEKLLVPPNVDKGTLYDASCIYAMHGKKEKALELLRRALAAGFADYNHINIDPDLVALRADPEFIRLLEEMEKSKK